MNNFEPAILFAWQPADGQLDQCGGQRDGGEAVREGRLEGCPCVCRLGQGLGQLRDLNALLAAPNPTPSHVAGKFFQFGLVN